MVPPPPCPNAAHHGRVDKAAPYIHRYTIAIFSVAAAERREKKGRSANAARTNEREISTLRVVRADRGRPAISEREREARDTWMRCGIVSPQPCVNHALEALACPPFSSTPRARDTRPIENAASARNRTAAYARITDYPLETVTHEEGQPCSVSCPPPAIAESPHPRS